MFVDFCNCRLYSSVTQKHLFPKILHLLGLSLDSPLSRRKTAEKRREHCILIALPLDTHTHLTLTSLVFHSLFLDICVFLENKWAWLVMLN